MFSFTVHETPPYAYEINERSTHVFTLWFNHFGTTDGDEDVQDKEESGVCTYTVTEPLESYNLHMESAGATRIRTAQIL